jgi:beta-glucosidase-like glycosyl hydrolase
MSRSLPELIGRVVWPDVRCSKGAEAVSALAPLAERYPPGGVIVFGEGQPDVEALIGDLRRLLGDELLVSSDLERGCGQQVAERSHLPPAMALAACGLPDAAYDAGVLTGCEARAAGIDVVYAPVADVNTAATNPIIATRAFGDDAHQVARLATAFARGVADGGALAVAKHWPGHGSTVQDSHEQLARVTRDADGLHGIDLLPFRALVASEVGGIMVGHLEVPALDPVPGRPATASPILVQELLRDRLGYDGLLVTDALDMGGFRQEPAAVAEVLAAGMDVALMPADCLAAAEALERSVEAGALDVALLERAAARIDAAQERVRAAPAVSRAPDVGLGERLLAASITRGSRPPLQLSRGQAVDLQLFGEDEGGFVIAAFKEALVAAGVSLSPDGAPVALVLTNVAAWSGSSRLEDRTRARLHWAIENERLAQVVVLGSPYELIDLPEGCPSLLAYEASPAAAFAVVAVMAGRAEASGRLPVGGAA